MCRWLPLLRLQARCSRRSRSVSPQARRVGQAASFRSDSRSPAPPLPRKANVWPSPARRQTSQPHGESPANDRANPPVIRRYWGCSVHPVSLGWPEPTDQIECSGTTTRTRTERINPVDVRFASPGRSCSLAQGFRSPSDKVRRSKAHRAEQRMRGRMVPRPCGEAAGVGIKVHEPVGRVTVGAATIYSLRAGDRAATRCGTRCCHCGWFYFRAVYRNGSLVSARVDTKPRIGKRRFAIQRTAQE